MPLFPSTVLHALSLAPSPRTTFSDDDSHRTPVATVHVPPRIPQSTYMNVLISAAVICQPRFTHCTLATTTLRYLYAFLPAV